MTQLKNKTIVVTGGNSGIGRATAELVQKGGGHVAIFGRNADTLAETARALGETVVSVRGDVTNRADLDTLFAKTAAAHGKIDGLVVNAGIAKLGSIAETTEAAFDQIMDINVKGAFFTVQAALPHLADGASIVLVTSALSSVGAPNMSVYAASKAALRSLARSLSAELADRRIRVNALSPGPIDTPIYGRLGVPQEAVQGIADAILTKVTAKRFGTADEVASAAGYLLSDAARYVVGSELSIDGGFAQT